MSPQVGQPVQKCNRDKDSGAVTRHAGAIKNVDSATQVDFIAPGGSVYTNLPYVEVGGTPPAAGTDYVQEIALA